VAVADVLIRDVPDHVLEKLEADARRVGLSRTEYLRRALARTAAAVGGKVTTEDLSWFAGTFEDLADPDLMHRAWQ
jgi:hypothetical protein